MATWVVGDVQGCFSTFLRLLDRIRWRPGRDRIRFAGDLVNRGPDSLGMLRWARDRGDSVVSVLGNHDLHLLARREGVLPDNRRDTLTPVLEAPDADELCDWVAANPFVHREGRFLLVHAGFLPEWDLGEIRRRAALAEGAIRSDRRGFLESLYALRRRPAAGPADTPAPGAAAEGVHAASIFTRIRIVDRAGNPDFEFDGPPEEIPSGYRPWFRQARAAAERTVLFGHWAALGLTVAEGAVCLDSGCVWDGSLTALRLDDGELRIQQAVPGDGRPP